MTLFEGNLPQKRQTKRDRERERASELDAKFWLNDINGNCGKLGTTG